MCKYSVASCPLCVLCFWNDSFVFINNKKSNLLALQEMVADGVQGRVGVHIISSLIYLLGLLKPLVDSVYEFEDVLKAYDRILSYRAKGKVVVKVDPTIN